MISILISSYNRLALFRRTLHAIAQRPPRLPFELVVCDERSTDNILGELEKYSSVFEWTFVRFDPEVYTRQTGLRKFFNNSAPCVNLAFKHSRGDLIVLQGNEVIVWGDCYNQMMGEIPQDNPYWLIFSTTYDIPDHKLAQLDWYGSNINQRFVDSLREWPLQSMSYRTDVFNYISLAPRSLWEALEGVNEQYFGGIACEDSDFVRRARALLGGCHTHVSDAVSLHQSHQGKNIYREADPSIITPEKWAEGLAINRKTYSNWDGTYKNPQEWPWGEFGVVSVEKNW